MGWLNLIIMLFITLLFSLGCADKTQTPEKIIIKQFTGPTAIIKQICGFDSGITQPHYYLLLSETDREQLIKEIGRGPYFEIDFRNEMCLVIFMGQLMGHRQIVTEIIEEPNRIVFRVDKPSYQTITWIETLTLPDGSKRITKTGNEPLGPSTPFGFFILPRATKKLILETKRDMGKGKKYKWVILKEFNP